MDDDNFDKMIENIQKKIDLEEEKTYSKIVIKEYRNPTHFGDLKKPDTIGQIKGSCGDTMIFSLKIVNNIIKDARFWTDGCGPSVASGNILAKMSIGKTIKDAEEVTSKTLLNALHGLPKEHKHCAVLAINTLRKAIKNYEKNKNISGRNK